VTIPTKGDERVDGGKSSRAREGGVPGAEACSSEHGPVATVLVGQGAIDKSARSADRFGRGTPEEEGVAHARSVHGRDGPLEEDVPARAEQKERSARKAKGCLLGRSVIERAPPARLAGAVTSSYAAVVRPCRDRPLV